MSQQLGTSIRTCFQLCSNLRVFTCVGERRRQKEEEKEEEKRQISTLGNLHRLRRGRHSESCVGHIHRVLRLDIWRGEVPEMDYDHDDIFLARRAHFTTIESVCCGHVLCSGDQEP